MHLSQTQKPRTQLKGPRRGGAEPAEPKQLTTELFGDDELASGAPPGGDVDDDLLALCSGNFASAKAPDGCAGNNEDEEEEEEMEYCEDAEDSDGEDEGEEVEQEGDSADESNAENEELQEYRASLKARKTAGAKRAVEEDEAEQRPIAK